MNYSARLLLATAITATLATFAHADIPATQTAKLDTKIESAKPDESRYLYEDQIKPGMKGYGLTVMTGGKIEKFDFEVIDVVKNFTPGSNAILVRCSGLGLEHSGIIAGMSGSPVFIDNKMIGAVAFGWGMAKDPIAGVQPIRQMLSIPGEKAEAETASAGGGARWSGNGVIEREAARLPGWSKLTASLARRAGSPSEISTLKSQPTRMSSPVDPRSMRPLASPLMVSGASASTMKLLADELAGTDLVPIASGSAGTAAIGESSLGGIAALKRGDIELAPGSAIAVPLLTGDIDLSAIGTVTEVRDGKVYAFGHGFLAEGGGGGTQLPIATGYIYSVMPNLQQSFKMGASLTSAGTLVMDEQRGIVGRLGGCPSTVPIKVSVRDGDSDPRIYHYGLSPHPKLAPEILNMMLHESLVAQRNLPRQFTAHVTGEATFATGPDKKSRTIKIDHVGATSSFNPSMPLLPVALLMDNPFENLRMTDLTLNATIEHANRSGRIVSVNVDRLTVAPGDEIHAVVEVDPFQKEPARIPVTIMVPADAAEGDYQLNVGTASMALELESQYAPQHFDPQDIAGLETAIDRITAYQAEKIYGTLVMNISGAAVAGQEKANLPASRLALYASNKRTDAAPVRRVVSVDVDAGAVLEDGGQSFAIHVDKKANQRYYEPKTSMVGGPGGSASHQPHIPLSAPPASAPSDQENP